MERLRPIGLPWGHVTKRKVPQKELWEDLPDRDWLHHMADTQHASMEADGAKTSWDYLWGYWLNSGGASPNLDTLLVCGKEHSGRRVTLGVRNRPSTQSVTSLPQWRQSKGCDSGLSKCPQKCTLQGQGMFFPSATHTLESWGLFCQAEGVELSWNLLS